MKPVIMSFRQINDKYRIITQPVQPYITPKEFFWVLNRADVEQNLADVTPAAMRHMHRENMEKYHCCRIIYTDGSKSKRGVRAAL